MINIDGVEPMAENGDPYYSDDNGFLRASGTIKMHCVVICI